MERKEKVPIWHKANLTLDEAAIYSNIGLHKLRSITEDEDCNFVLWIGNKRLIKRELFDKYMNESYSL
ncbi:excisionase [Limosilactobacillus reuteri]|uniref:excisionase n=1 Tax=Limosilactobacillus reuteri TaxID=1598 RepID=UPI0021A54A58|nr:excisionase [Limosilactobacillus reuteri]MCT3201689.1 transposase [Limosilactobacillus reuteri]MDC6076232.1 excisionase [Limosilactobacillus reuteri]